MSGGSQRSEGNTSRQGIWEWNGLGRGGPELGSVLAISWRPHTYVCICVSRRKGCKTSEQVKNYGFSLSNSI